MQIEKQEHRLKRAGKEHIILNKECDITLIWYVMI